MTGVAAPAATGGPSRRRDVGSFVEREERPLEVGVRWLRLADWGPQLLIVWLASLVHFLALDPDPARYAATVAAVSLCQSFLLAGGYLANDYFDRDQDRLDAARAPMKPRSARARGIAMVALMGIGLATAHGLASTPAMPVIAWAQVALGLAYSAPGIRLKERGAMGVLAAALLQRLPAFVMIALAFPARPMVAAIVGLWIALIGLVSILEHQLNDEASDRAAGVRTWCVTHGVPACRLARKAFYVSFVIVTLVGAIWLAGSRAGRGQAAAVLLVAMAAGFVGLARRRLRYHPTEAREAGTGTSASP